MVRRIGYLFLVFSLIDFSCGNFFAASPSFLAPWHDFKGRSSYSQRVQTAFDYGPEEEAPLCWQEHIEESRKGILAAAAQVERKRRVLVLGVGKGREIPLVELAEAEESLFKKNGY